MVGMCGGFMKKLLLFLFVSVSFALLGQETSATGSENSTEGKTVSVEKIDESKETEEVIEDESYSLDVVQDNQKRSKISRSVDVLKEKEIKQINTGFIGDYFKEINGVHFQQTATGQASPYLRGMTGRLTGLTFDGIRLNNAIFRSGPNQYVSIMDSFIISKIEVFRGSESPLYGSDALGGSIAYYSKNPSNALGTTFIYDTSNDSFVSNINAGIKEDNFSVGFDFTTNDSGNLEGGEGVGIQDFTSFHYYAFSGKSNIDFGKYGQVTLFGSYFSQLDGYRTDKSTAGNYIQFDEQNHGIYYLNHKIHSNSLKTTLASTFAYQTTYQETSTYKDAALNLNQVDEVYQYAALFRANTFISDFSLFYGIELTRDHVDSEASKTGKEQFLDDADYDMYSQYLKVDYKWNDLVVGVGERLTYVWLHELEDTTGEMFEYKNFNAAFSGFAQYNLTNDYSVAFNISQGLRNPNLSDLAGNVESSTGFEIGNKDLKPEESLMYEIVQKYKAHGLNLILSAYYVDLTNFISKEKLATNDIPEDFKDKGTVYKKQNLNKSHIYGGEFGLEYKYKSQFDVKGSVYYTYGEEDYTDAEWKAKKDKWNASNPTKTVATPYMSKIPPLSGFLKLTGHYNDNVDFIYKMTYAMEQDNLSISDLGDVRIPDGGTPAFLIHSIGVSFLFEKVQIHTFLNNISDEKYKYHASGVWGAGRSLNFKLSYQF